MKVELQNIFKSFGSVQANQDVSLTVSAGSIHGILGENGAGKSTLVKILSGFIHRDGGHVLLDDRPVDLKSPAEAIGAGIGMLHQDPLDFPPLTVLDNFMVGKRGGLWVHRSQTIREFRQLCAQFNFILEVQQLVSTLTVGERQQLELLRLLSLGVQTLILDEPTTGISASQKQALFEAAKQLAAQGKSIIFVSHKLEDVEILCDRVTVMRQGQVVGHADIPCPHEDLIQLIFGRELATPNKPPTRQEAIVLHLDQVHLKSDRLTLNLPELNLHQGEVIGLAGLEGNGQELLLQFCAGLIQPIQGEMSLGGHSLTHKPYAEFLKAGIGYLPADRLKHGLIAGLSIQDHVALRQSVETQRWFLDRPSIAQKTQEAIALFNIRGKPQTAVDRLSGGNQQRTQLSLLPVPLTLLLMEHPTRGLDIESTLWVWQQLIARCQTGTTIIFTSSDLDEIMQYSDRLLVFSGGKVSPLLETHSLTVEQLGQQISGKMA